MLDVMRIRTETWLSLLVVGIAAIPIAVLGLWGFMKLTAETLHPEGVEIPSVASGPVEATWEPAATHGREVVRSALREQNLPGLSVAVGVGGSIVWAEGFGWAELETREKVRPDTQFRIGTASKALTSAGVGLLVERGALKLDVPVQTWLRDFPHRVTLRQVMAQTSGMRSDGGDEGPLFGERCERPGDGVRLIQGLSLRFEPGTAYRESAYGWIVASAAIDAAAPEPFASFMRREVFDPIGMTSTRLDSLSDPPARLATPYFPRFAANPRDGLHLMRPIDLSCYAGGAGFVSTPSDLVRFGMALQDARLLKPETTRTLQTAQVLSSGESTGYGLGWKLDTVSIGGQPTRVVGHDGDVLGGPVVTLMIVPSEHLVVAVASNISYADTALVAVRVADAFASTRPSPPR